MQRRKFLKAAGVFATGFYASRFPVIAGPFLPGESGGYQIPIDKKLDPTWIKSLYLRGNPTRYFKSKNELQFIGMPVGGINTGTLYLGGDGRLWLWDIFNDNREGVDPKEVPWDSEVHAGKKVRSRDGSAYVSPAKNIRPVDQGFAFKIATGAKTVIKRMESSDWDDIIFEATYPIATITFVDKQWPVEIVAEVFSPFIPLDVKNSGLPATLYSFRIKNASSAPVKVEITGWLENKTCITHAKEDHQRINKVVKKNGAATVQCSIESKTDDGNLRQLPDYGTQCITCIDQRAYAISSLHPETNDGLFIKAAAKESRSSTDSKLVGGVGSLLNIKPNQTASLDFIIAWHFPNLSFKAIADTGRYYNTFFKSGTDVRD